jgi:hypothetical protein
MNTQTRIDLNDARNLAGELHLDCEINWEEDLFTITLDTGEVEMAAGLPGVTTILYAYAQR